MRTATIVLALLLALALVAPASITTHERPLKGVATPIPDKGDGKEGGETIGTAILVLSLPFDDTGNTCDNVDDYDEACPFTGSTSPDVVYAYVPPYDMLVDIHTCESGYDTKLYVYENEYPSPYYACNDDNPNCPGASFRSWIESLALTGGNTYYIVVDGYGGDCGDYGFHMYELDDEGAPCDVVCPPGAVLEDEPTCYDGYVDAFNGGCNSTPPVFSALPPGPHVTICGESGVFDNISTRDTDWYELPLNSGREVKLTICADFPVIFGFVDGSAGCPGATLDYFDTAGEFTTGVLSEYLPAGLWWIFVSTNGWMDGYPCGVEYIMDIDGGGGVSPVESTSWTTIKSLYR